MEIQREQLRSSEEKANLTNELQLKLENVTEELNHKYFHLFSSFSHPTSLTSQLNSLNSFNSLRKDQLELASQMYQEVNVSYQREKRKRENIETEYQKVQNLLKANEENKIQLATRNENMRRDIQLSQEANRVYEVILLLLFCLFVVLIIILTGKVVEDESIVGKSEKRVVQRKNNLESNI